MQFALLIHFGVFEKLLKGSGQIGLVKLGMNLVQTPSY